MKNTAVVNDLLHKVAGIKEMPSGAFNIRVNGKSIARANSSNVTIVPRENGQGMDIHVKPGTKGEKIHIPVAIDITGVTDIVTNNFYIGENCEDILIVAGCGIHNGGCSETRHDGIHYFHIGKNAKVVYKERHYANGNAEGARVINPITEVFLESGSSFEMESIQIEGVDSTNRITKGVLAEESLLLVTEKLMTNGTQTARTEFVLEIEGRQAKAKVASRSVAKDHSRQDFISRITGNNACAGRSECDAIIMDSAIVSATPEIIATHVDAELVHEASIGKIAGEQLLKLMTLGLTKEEAENHIINGFLK